MTRMMLCMTQESPTLTPQQAAERLKAAGVPSSGETVRRWVKAGRLRGAIVLPSGRIRIPAAVIDGITGAGADGRMGLPVDEAETVAAPTGSAAEAEAPQDQAAQEGRALTPSHHR
ncbi:hypothetical protein [Micromonospora sp. 4G55]|uniref:hypothetical protein n=1 Tax=Micromonospora sp. 4G55 TaxID=2806102 RepID=UPI001EE4D2B8|nr:hypothetical protein [Micromonospora sp. 4G55]